MKHAMIALGLTLGLGITSAHAAGFDCTKAHTKVEKMICADADLSAKDSRMNELAEKVSNETAGVDGDTGRRVNPFGREQKRWIDTVRNRCASAMCLNRVYDARIHAIETKWSDAL